MDFAFRKKWKSENGCHLYSFAPLLTTDLGGGRSADGVTVKQHSLSYENLLF